MDSVATKNNSSFSPVLCIKKLKGFNIILKACKHNFREIPQELLAEGRIDPTRTRHNQILIGRSNATEAKLQYDQVVESTNLSQKIRKDAVLGIEILFCLPGNHTLNEEVFFARCIEWCKEYFGVFILSAIVHKDESNPHCHAILIPLINGRLQGSKLCGGPSKIRGMQEDFYKKVGIHFGLTKPRPSIRYKSEYLALVATQIVNLMTCNELVIRDDGVRKELIHVISNDPMDLAQMVGILRPSL